MPEPGAGTEFAPSPSGFFEDGFVDMEHNDPTIDRTLASFGRLADELADAYRALEHRAASLERRLMRADREKARLAHRLGAVLDGVPGAVLVVDGDARVRDANATALEWLGADLIGSRQSELGGTGSSTAAREVLLADGRHVSIFRQSLHEADETVILLTDVTVERQLQRRLEQHRRLARMGELAARVAHQIRTPVSAAMLYAGQLADEELASDTRRVFSNRILGRLRDLERMTRDMLQFVRSDGGQRPTETFSLGALLEDVRSSVAASGTPADRLEPRLGAVGSTPLRGDRQALVGAFSNLVENAWQSDEAGVCVRIEAAACDSGLIELRVIDDGPGIDTDIAEHVFDPFFSGRCGGTGLGLAVARSVLESHGGAIELCDPPGERGCEFRIRLPAAAYSAMRGELPANAGARA